MRTSRYRKPRPEEELKAWHHLAWHIDFKRKVAMDHAAVVEALDRISAWVSAHSDHNGERPQDEVEDNVNEAFWRKIAQIENPPELPKRGRPPKNREKQE